MASCDVQDTLLNSKSMNSTSSTPPAETQLAGATSSSNVPRSSIPKRIPGLVTIKKTNPKISLSSTPSKVIKITETSVNGTNKTIYQNGIMLKPTKIPAPIGNMGKNYTPRKYTTLLKNIKRKTCPENDSFGSTNTLVNLTEDSGIHMDCSGLEDDVAVGESHIIQPEPQVSSETIGNLTADEQETLRVLQRAVAEMEEDIENRYMEEVVGYKEDSQMKDTVNEGVEVEKGNEEAQPEPPAQAQIEQELSLATDPICEEEQDEVESSSNRSTIIRERKHVRVEQLLEAEHDIELLQKLLQPPNEQLDADAPLFEELPQSEPNSSSEVDKILNSPDDDTDDRSDDTIHQVGLLYSLLNIFCGKSIRNLRYPVLICGLAAGLVFYFRKI